MGVIVGAAADHGRENLSSRVLIGQAKASANQAGQKVCSVQRCSNGAFGWAGVSTSLRLHRAEGCVGRQEQVALLLGTTSRARFFPTKSLIV